MKKDYSLFTVVQLKNKLRKKSLRLTGNKAELIQRLINNDRLKNKKTITRSQNVKINPSTCDLFRKNNTVNPNTKRRISITGNIFKTLDKQCREFVRSTPVSKKTSPVRPRSVLKQKGSKKPKRNVIITTPSGKTHRPGFQSPL